MRINLSPRNWDAPLRVLKYGDVLTINGTKYGFTSIPEGGSLPASATDCAFLEGDISRVNGELHLTLILPHGSNPSREVAFPVPLLEVRDGEVPLPFDEPGSKEKT